MRLSTIYYSRQKKFTRRRIVTEVSQSAILQSVESNETFVLDMKVQPWSPRPLLLRTPWPSHGTEPQLATRRRDQIAPSMLPMRSTEAAPGRSDITSCRQLLSCRFQWDVTLVHSSSHPCPNFDSLTTSLRQIRQLA